MKNPPFPVNAHSPSCRVLQECSISRDDVSSEKKLQGFHHTHSRPLRSCAVSSPLAFHHSQIRVRFFSKTICNMHECARACYTVDYFILSSIYDYLMKYPLVAGLGSLNFCLQILLRCCFEQYGGGNFSSMQSWPALSAAGSLQLTVQVAHSLNLPSHKL